MTSKTEQHTEPTNLIITDVSDSVTRAFSQEIFLIIFISLFVWIRQKIVTIISNNKLKKQYFKSGATTHRIAQLLKDCLKVIKADRIMILQLHNGNKFLGNLSQVKVTMTHQEVSTEIKPVDKIINYPFSYFYTEFQLIKDRKDIVWLHKEEATEKCQIYLDSMGTELIGLKAFYNNANIPIAILGIHYCSQDYIFNLSDQNKEKELSKLLKTINELL